MRNLVTCDLRTRDASAERTLPGDCVSLSLVLRYGMTITRIKRFDDNADGSAWRFRFGNRDLRMCYRNL